MYVKFFFLYPGQCLTPPSAPVLLCVLINTTSHTCVKHFWHVCPRAAEPLSLAVTGQVTICSGTVGHIGDIRICIPQYGAFRCPPWSPWAVTSLTSIHFCASKQAGSGWFGPGSSLGEAFGTSRPGAGLAISGQAVYRELVCVRMCVCVCLSDGDGRGYVIRRVGGSPPPCSLLSSSSSLYVPSTSTRTSQCVASLSRAPRKSCSNAGVERGNLKIKKKLQASRDPVTATRATS